MLEVRLKAVTTLHHFALVNFEVDPLRLRPLIPPAFDLDRTAAGETLISAVPFRDVDFRYPLFPWVGFDFWQINYRAYIVERATGRRCVWFFGTDLGSPLVHIPRLQWGLPWHRASFEAAHSVGFASYFLRSSSRMGSSLFAFQVGSREPELCAADFEMLTNPMQGFYRRLPIPFAGLGTYSIEHSRMRLMSGLEVFAARVEAFERLALIRPYQVPHSVYVADPIEFKINLPPGTYPQLK